MSTSRWLNLYSEETWVLVYMLRRRYSLADVARRLDITRQYVYEIRQRLTDSYGESLCGSHLLSFREAAQEFGSTYRQIRRIVRKQEIPVVKRFRGTYVHRKYLEEIQDILFVSCRVCPSPIPLSRSGNVTCSRKCQKKRKKEMDKSIPRRAWQNPLVVLTGRPKELYLHLQSHTLPEDEEWVTEKKAAEISEIQAGTLNQLRRRGIFSIRSHPSWIRGGKTVKMYSVSELKIARYVYNGDSI